MAAELAVVLGCLGSLLGAGIVERATLARARRAIPIRIHVNGTRGKSTVTRLVRAGLRAAGRCTLGKTTGTAARLLLPDGSEAPVARRGLANIREQVGTIRLAARLGAEALVLECMALRPELQWISEHVMVRSTIGVITNVRTDHLEVMGPSLESAARALAGTVPRRGVLVLGEAGSADACIERAARLETRVVVASEGRSGLDGAVTGPEWLKASTRTALAVTRLLGIEDSVALQGMLGEARDPGASRVVSLRAGSSEVPCLDASAANDPESLSRLVAELLPDVPVPSRPALVVFNHRADRPTRLPVMAAAGFGLEPPVRLILTGDRPPLSQRRALRRAGLGDEHVPMGELGPAVQAHLERSRAVVLCGNTRGLSLEGLLGEGSPGREP